jgi:DNA-binding transcriptional MerR regulator
VYQGVDQHRYIGDICRELGVTPRYLRRLEAQGFVPRANRDALGRIYSPGDVALLKALGVGARPQRLKTIEEVAG